MSEEIKINDKKIINGWAMFDWANSSYNLVISTAIFPPFFTSLAPETMNFLGMEINSTTMYSLSVAIAFLFSALLSPMLSGIADYSGRRIIFLKFFTLIGAVFCSLLYYFDDSSDAIFAIVAFTLGTIGFTSSQVFYNALLPLIATEDRFDRISAKGYAYGYVGSVILLVFILIMGMYPEFFGIADAQTSYRIGFFLVGAWWLLFAQITFRRMPNENKLPYSSDYLKKGIKEVVKVYHKVLKDRNIKLFLISFFFFTSGVYTVIYMAGIFAQQELNFGSIELIVLILLLQFLALIGAYVFAFLSEKIGNKKTMLIQIFVWVVICIAAYFTKDKTTFYVIAAFVGLVMGGIQSLGRSTYSKMIEENKSELNSYFSFYDVLAKVSVVLGTFLFGFINQITGNMRYSVLSLIALFALGFISMAMVNEKKIVTE